MNSELGMLTGLTLLRLGKSERREVGSLFDSFRLACDSLSLQNNVAVPDTLILLLSEGNTLTSTIPTTLGALTELTGLDIGRSTVVTEHHFRQYENI